MIAPRLTVASLLALAALEVLWSVALAPLPQARWLWVKAIPLAILVPGVMRGARKPRQWVALGCLHGIAVLLTMNYVILPLSAIGHGIYPLEKLHIHAFWHILLVGLPTGLFVSRALRQR